MSKKHTPSETRIKLQTVKMIIRPSRYDGLMTVCSIPPFFKHIFLQYCKRWCYVSDSVSRLEGVTRSLTHTHQIVLCESEQENTNDTPLNPPAKRIDAMLKAWVSQLMSAPRPLSCHTPRSYRKETSCP